jgi:hypothetical protein
MMRKPALCAVGLIVAVLCAGCGHDGIITGTLPGQPPATTASVTGAVLAPNSTFARASVWDRFASLIVSPVYALSDNVQPIGPDQVVTLAQVAQSDAADGTIDSAHVVSSALTNNGGRFAVPVVGGVQVGDCGLLLEVGRASNDTGTLTRALVYAEDGQDLSAVSEAVVRRILAYLAAAPGRSLCAFSPDEIANITFLVQDASANAGGASVAEINDQVDLIATTSTAINQAIESAGSS